MIVYNSEKLVKEIELNWKTVACKNDNSRLTLMVVNVLNACRQTILYLTTVLACLLNKALI